LRILGSQQHPQSGVLLTSFSTWGTENSLAEINLESTGAIKDCNIFWGKKFANICIFVGGRIILQQKKSRERKSSFRIRRTTLWDFKDSTIIIDAIRWSFFTKSAATAAMFTSVRVDFGRPPLSSSTSTLPSRNREHHLKILIGSGPYSHKPFATIQVFLSQIARL
jgi:hypothetical protein